MKNKTVELVAKWGEFEMDHPDGSIDDFCRHYLAQAQKNPIPSMRDQELDKLPMEIKLARSMGRLVRFHSFYARKALTDLDFKNLDDFLYLNSLRRMKGPKKSELIYENISEFSSGSEIIRRLIRLGLAKESPDKNDRRSKRLHITSKGEKTLFKCYDKMREISAIAFSTMSKQDQEIAGSIFIQQDNFHTDIYERVKNKDYAEVKGAILSSRKKSSTY
jgi:DNA-binding MarR family transcriptional regulator